MNLLILVVITAVIIFASGWWKLSRKKFAIERIVCFFLGHDVAKDELVQEMGALFHGSICKRCMRFRFGKFVFNYWDESKTEVKDGVHRLSGINPQVKNEGWKIIGDYEQLVQVSEMLCAKKKRVRGRG